MTLTIRKRRTRRRHGEAGAELIEFALAFPLLLLIVLGIVDFAFLLHHHEVVTNAAREGARVATLPGYGATDVQNRVNAYLQAGGLGGTPTITVTPTTIPQGISTWPATSVNVSYTHDYMFIGGIVSWFGGGGFGATTLQGQTTMRNELGP